MGSATLAVYAGPGDGERLYRAAAEVFGFPDWQILWPAARTGTAGDILPDAYPGLEFTLLLLLVGDGPGRQACMVQRVQDGKPRAAVVMSDGTAVLMIPTLERWRLDELVADLERILRKLPEDTVVRVWAELGTDVDVMEASVADVMESLIEAAGRACGSE